VTSGATETDHMGVDRSPRSWRVEGRPCPEFPSPGADSSGSSGGSLYTRPHSVSVAVLNLRLQRAPGSSLRRLTVTSTATSLPTNGSNPDQPYKR